MGGKPTTPANEPPMTAEEVEKLMAENSQLRAEKAELERTVKEIQEPDLIQQDQNPIPQCHHAPSPSPMYEGTDQFIEPGDHVKSRYNSGLKAHHAIVSGKNWCEETKKWNINVIEFGPWGLRQSPLSAMTSESCGGKTCKDMGNFRLQVCNYSDAWFGSRWWHNKYYGRPRDPAQVVKAAELWLERFREQPDDGASCYDWKSFNCESFARMCKLGPTKDNAISLQVNRGSEIALCMLVALWGSAIALNFLFAGFPTIGLFALHLPWLCPIGYGILMGLAETLALSLGGFALWRLFDGSYYYEKSMQTVRDTITKGLVVPSRLI